MATASQNKFYTDGKFVLPGKMQIDCLEPLCKEMRKVVSRKRKSLVIDSGEVSMVDAAGIQLIVAFIRELGNKDCEVSWDNYSVQLHQLAQEMGVAEVLDF